MSFTSIPTGWLDTGDPVKKELMDRIKDDLDDLDTRTSTVEAATTSETPIIFQVVGPYWNEGSSITNAASVIRVPYDITLKNARLFLEDDGSSGTLTVDVKYSTDSGSTWTTIFSSAPSIAQGGGDYGTDTGTLSVTDIDAGDLLKLDITSVMSGNEAFSVIMEWEVR